MKVLSKRCVVATVLGLSCLLPATGGERIIDNDDGGFVADSSYWILNTAAGYAGDYRHDNGRQKGTAHAYWIYLVTPDVPCDVYVTWVIPTAQGTGSVNVPYTVEGIAGGDQTFYVNHNVEPVADLMRGGRPFQKLGTFTPTSYKLQVHLHTEGTTSLTYVVADATMVISDGLPGSTETVIDSSGGTPGWLSSGVWTLTASGQTYAYNGNIYYTLGTTAGRECTWNFTGLTPNAIYDVAASWQLHANRATNTPYQVQGVEGGDVTVRINQEIKALNHHNAGGVPFQSLGLYTTTGSTLTVRMYSGEANEYIIADAVLVQYVASASVPPDKGTLITIR